MDSGWLDPCHFGNLKIRTSCPPKKNISRTRPRFSTVNSQKRYLDANQHPEWVAGELIHLFCKTNSSPRLQGYFIMKESHGKEWKKNCSSFFFFSKQFTFPSLQIFASFFFFAVNLSFNLREHGESLLIPPSADSASFFHKREDCSSLF